MARCYYLEYTGGTNPFGSNEDCYLCKLSGQTMDFDSIKVKNTCKAEYGEKYKDCPIYKSKA